MTCSVIGHRGFKAKYTENTIQGFTKCFEAGASAIETDVWTTKDNVLVISHDVNTARIFCDENGQETGFNILETDFSELCKLRTSRSGEPLLTFKDLLVWFREFAQGEYSECKIMLDLKNSNPPALLKLLVEDVMDVGGLEWWYPRLQLGIWHIRFLQYLNQDEFFHKVVEDAFFDIFHISLSWQDTMTYLSYADHLSDRKRKFAISGVSMIYVSTWSAECLHTFLPAVKAHGLKFVNWTINRRWQMEYFTDMCTHYGVREYAVIADDPREMVRYIAEKRAARAPVILWKFHLVHWLITALARVSPKSPLISRTLFDTRVDAWERLPPRPRLGNKIFAFLQAMGIF